MSPRSDEGWPHYRAAEAMYAAEVTRGSDRDWTPFDVRLQRARSCADRDGDSHLMGASLELQAARWEIARFQGEVLGALGGALAAYERILDPALRLPHVDRVKQLIANWYRIPRVFISYARRDRRRVLAAVHHLECDAGAEVVIDVATFVPGVDLSQLIDWSMGHVISRTRADVARAVDQALQVAGVYMVFWSRSYAARPWTTWELDRATAHLAELRRAGRVGPRVTFVLLDDEPVPRRHRNALWIDLRRGLTAAGRAELTRAVTGTEMLSPIGRHRPPVPT